MIRPAGADVGDHQAEYEGTAHVVPAMGHQVNLQETRWGPVPIGEGAHWNVAAWRQVPPALAPTGHGGTDRLEQPVQRGRTGRQQSLPYLGVQIQMTMALHGLHQVGQRRLQALAADAVGSLPDHDHRLTDRLVVDAPTLDHRLFLLSVAGLAQQPDAVLAVVAGYGDELIEDPTLVLLG